MSAYVGASAPLLNDLRSATLSTADDIAQRRARIARMLAEAGETGAPGSGLELVETGLRHASCDIGAAATIAAADAHGGGQSGWRSSLGGADDFLFDVLWVNDLSRVLTGRDINTGTEVGAGGRLTSAVFLIPFAKLAKVGKVAKLGDEAVEVSSRAATSSARAAVHSGADVAAVLSSLPRGRGHRVREIGSVAELDDLFAHLSREGRPVPIGHGGASVLLPDGTRVSRRATSDSGGPTIDVRLPLPSKVKMKVHVSPWPPTG